MNKILQQLVVDGVLKSFVYKEQIPSIDCDTSNRLIDELTLEFPNGKSLELSTICSGCLENTSLYIKEKITNEN